MAEATQYMFDYQEVLEELIRKQNLHEGKWRLIFELGFAATNMNTPEPPDGAKVALRPAGVVLVQKVGIARTEESNNLTLDASIVNPKPPTKSTKRPSKKRR
jgi:hypothetical protein